MRRSDLPKLIIDPMHAGRRLGYFIANLFDLALFGLSQEIFPLVRLRDAFDKTPDKEWRFRRATNQRQPQRN